MESEIPSRDPTTYCRLCLSQVNLLTVLGSPDEANTSPTKEVLQKLYQYTKITLSAKEDYPCSICGICKTQLSEFHEFRRNVVRNHNAVKIFRRTFGDEIVPIEVEEEQTFVEIIDNHQLVDVIREEYGDAELKEVDVYHVDGEFRTLVLKQEPEASPPGPLPTLKHKPQVSPKKPPLATTVNILNKSGGQATPPSKVPAKKIIKTSPAGTAFTVFKCSQCRAVFQSNENLTIHERTDHQPLLKSTPATAAKRLVVHKPETRKPSPPKRPLPKPTVSAQSKKLLFKCTSCSSSFVQEANLKQHQITCKPAALSKLNLSQITVKRTKVQQGYPAGRIKCSHCPLTYKSRLYLERHLLEDHQVQPDPAVPLFCAICSLHYSCLADLALHNRAMHPFLCLSCKGDFRVCLHRQPSVREAAAVENGANKVKAT